MAKRSKQEQRRLARQEARQQRIDAQRKRVRARRRRKLLPWALVVALGLGLAGFGVARNIAKRRSAQKAAEAAGCSGIREIESMGAQHVQPDQAPDEYNSTPATSGPHLPLAEWGSQPETLPPYQYVHNLEHGGVVIQYQGLTDEEVEELQEFVDSYREGVIVMPNEELTTKIAMSAWTRLQTCERFSLSAVEGFISTRCGKGPEKIITCSG